MIFYSAGEIKETAMLFRFAMLFSSSSVAVPGAVS